MTGDDMEHESVSTTHENYGHLLHDLDDIAAEFGVDLNDNNGNDN